MTIVSNNNVQQRTWRGYDDPGLPVGMYIAQGLVTGNGTGGQMEVIFQFRNEGSAASGRFYNIEQVECQISATTTREIFIKATNWDIIGPAGLINREWSAQVTNNNNDIAAMATIRQFPLPIFLGITSPVPSLAAQIEVGSVNVDLTALTATIQGYIWEARSVMAEGGLRRPVDSLYGGGKQ